jgi:hypothetical protein
MHEECARYSLRVCPHLVAPSSSVSVAITAPRYTCRHLDVLACGAADYWPHRRYKRVEWWSKGKQVIDRDEILALLAGETEETRNAVAQFLQDERRRAAATSTRLLGDEIELNGTVVGRLLPGLKLSLRDELIWVFDAVGEDAETVAELEGRIAQLEAPAR